MGSAAVPPPGCPWPPPAAPLTVVAVLVAGVVEGVAVTGGVATTVVGGAAVVVGVLMVVGPVVEGFRVPLFLVLSAGAPSVMTGSIQLDPQGRVGRQHESVGLGSQVVNRTNPNYTEEHGLSGYFYRLLPILIPPHMGRQEALPPTRDNNDIYIYIRTYYTLISTINVLQYYP